ncbi:hypothetical protein C1646_757621 [Rhizophagus diaphanus]|nr:hypothetical protein C1646_757621 [Rhizophagus diaphanus] [Rhizophagus sp. MUCL 43196]
MLSTSTVTTASYAQKFPEDFFVNNGKLMCHFCDHSINFQTKNTITTHIGSKTHLHNMMYFNNQNSAPTTSPHSKIKSSLCWVAIFV